MPAALTDPALADALLAVDTITGDKGRPPTLNELAEHMNRARTTVHHWLMIAKVRGYLDWEYGKARTMSVTEDGRALLIRTGKLAVSHW